MTSIPLKGNASHILAIYLEIKKRSAKVF